MVRSKPLRIGLSARLFHPRDGATGIESKTLQVLEQSIAQWIMSRDVLVLMVPSILKDGPIHRSNIRLRDYAEYLDGLVLQGGADVSPEAYGETPLQEAWAGDRVRDAYEMELLHEFVEAGKPVLGICVGMQILFDRGVEHGVDTAGCGFLPGVVESLDAPVVPHMGWNTVTPGPGSELFSGVGDQRFYFVHSYGVKASEVDQASFTVTTTDYGTKFVAAIETGSLSATQFHPEKSGDAGLQLLSNWVGTL